MDYKDYYQLLGVARDASADEVKRAYRRLARQHHPDVNKTTGAAARMSEINEAYAVLGDPERRAAYDALGTRQAQDGPFTPPPGWAGAQGWHFGEDGPASFSGPGGLDDEAFSEFFAQLFGRMHGGQAGAAPRRPAASATRRRGEDLHATLTLDLAQAWRGGLQHIELAAEPAPGGRRRGAAARGKALEVRIPPGVHDGQSIRLAGQGGAGTRGAPAGDLYLAVKLQPHPRYTWDGHHLRTELPVSPWEAGLGAVLPLTLPDGQRLQVRVPAGAQSGSLLAVHRPGGGPGELELTVRVLLPSAQDPRVRAAWQRLAAELHDFDARQQAQAEARAERKDSTG
jgi:curved DNA-binding protein